MLVYFKPPAGSPPVEIEGLGRVWLFQPPDQIWKKVKEKHNVAPKRDPYNKSEYLKDEHGKVQYTTAERKKWVVDEEKTKLLKAGKISPPADAHEIPDEIFKIIGAGKNTAVAAFFKKAADVDANLRKAYDEQMREGEKKRAALLAQQEAEIRELEEKHALRVAELQKKAPKA